MKRRRIRGTGCVKTCKRCNGKGENATAGGPCLYCEDGEVEDADAAGFEVDEPDILRMPIKAEAGVY